MDEVLLPLPSRGRTGKLRGTARDAEACRLKALGWSLEEVASKLDFPSPNHAGVAIRRALATTVRVSRDETRLIELQSLEEMESRLWRELASHHIMVSNGRVVRDEFDVALPDDRFTLECIDRILKIKERRARFLGLDAPTRAEVLTIDSVDSAIRDLENEIAQHKKSSAS